MRWGGAEGGDFEALQPAVTKEKYFDPETGAHFDIDDLMDRIEFVQQMRVELEESWKNKGAIQKGTLMISIDEVTINKQP